MIVVVGPDSGRASISGTTLFAGVKARFDVIRGDKDGGREMVDSAGVVDGVSVDDDVKGTEWLCAIDWNCSVCCWTWCAARISSKTTMVQYPSRDESIRHWPSGDLWYMHENSAGESNVGGILTNSYP